MENIVHFSNFSDSRLNESLGGGRDNTKEGGVKNFNYSRIVVLDGSLFKLGKDQIDTNNDQFKKAVEILKPMKDSTIVVTGSASAVGNDKGYNNKKLAEDRAKNFIAALKNAGVNTERYIANYVVGKATIPNSAQANAEQNVTFKIKENGSAVKFELDRDNTAVVMPKIDKIKNIAPPIVTDGEYEYMVYKVTYKKGKGSQVADAITKAAKDSGAYLRNISKEYTNLINKK
jgi:hypothetical protein